jgi:dihydroorotate dehydrogenase electron transfer subunit
MIEKQQKYNLKDVNKIRNVSILEIKDENTTVKTFTFKDELCVRANPGQFLMLWLPGVDEIPLSILDVKEKLVSVAVKKVGKATETLHNKKIGENIGIRGPFGNNFTINRGSVLMVSGGTGTAPLFFLAKRIALNVKKLFFIVGAKTKDDLIFFKTLKKDDVSKRMHLIFTTEDGSFGVKGLATKALENVLEKKKVDMIYTCGPEKMIRKVFDLAEEHSIFIEASLERLIRCAMGLCGSCVIGKYRVCKDGPVFNSKQLKEIINEFGIVKRNFEGRKVFIE